MRLAGGYKSAIIVAVMRLVCLHIIIKYLLKKYTKGDLSCRKGQLSLEIV